MEHCEQKDLFGNPMAPSRSQRVIIEIRGLGPVPSFKNMKRSFAWIDKARSVTQFFQEAWWIRKDSIKLMARPITETEAKEWMEKAVQSIESQLRSALQITDEKIQTVALAQSWIASQVPLDDCWRLCREEVVRSELCHPGEEGATIVIERIQ